jgi:RNA recognition motif-containing protein
MGEYKTRRAADTFDAGVRQLFVGNLHFKATDADLRALFEQCGTVVEAVVARWVEP